MSEPYSPQQMKTVRAYLEGMLVTIRENYDRQTRIIEGKLRWLNDIENPPLFLVDSKGTVTVGTAIKGGHSAMVVADDVGVDPLGR